MPLRQLNHFWNATLMSAAAAVLGFYVPPTTKVIWRRDLGLKSHLKD